MIRPGCMCPLNWSPGVGLISALWCWPCPVLSCPVLCSQRVNGAVCEYGLPAGLGAGAGEAVWDAEPSSGGGAEVMCRHPAPPPPQHAGNMERPQSLLSSHLCTFSIPWILPRSEEVHLLSRLRSSSSHLCGHAWRLQSYSTLRQWGGRGETSPVDFKVWLLKDVWIESFRLSKEGCKSDLHVG